MKFYGILATRITNEHRGIIRSKIHTASLSTKALNTGVWKIWYRWPIPAQIKIYKIRAGILERVIVDDLEWPSNTGDIFRDNVSKNTTNYDAVNNKRKRSYIYRPIFVYYRILIEVTVKGPRGPDRELLQKWLYPENGTGVQPFQRNLGGEKFKNGSRDPGHAPFRNDQKATIWHSLQAHKIWRLSQVHYTVYVISPDFCVEYQNIHFWQPYSVRNQKNNVSICS